MISYQQIITKIMKSNQINLSNLTNVQHKHVLVEASKLMLKKNLTINCNKSKNSKLKIKNHSIRIYLVQSNLILIIYGLAYLKKI